MLKRKVRKLPPVKTNDPFEREGRRPDYKKPDELMPYLTERGKIQPKARTGLTSKTQRRLTIAVKRARHLALLPFVLSAR